MPLFHTPSHAALLLGRPVPLRRLAPLAATAVGHRRRVLFFHNTRILRDDADPRSHYDVLNITPDASAAEIKKSFYSLSKTHHPDHNPSDPGATARFGRIAEAYAVLGHADKRARYDRDVLGRAPSAHRHAGRAHGGSYHSTSGAGATQAGGRPASGLSRRRGTFQGPPPSFFRSGGWGAQAAKRRAAAGAGSGTGTGTAGGGAEMGGMGPGQDPFGRAGAAPHFDAAGHERTQRRSDERRAARVRDGVSFSPGLGMVGNFFMIVGVLGLAVAVPYYALTGWGSMQRQEKKGDKNAIK